MAAVAALAAAIVAAIAAIAAAIVAAIAVAVAVITAAIAAITAAITAAIAAAVAVAAGALAAVAASIAAACCGERRRNCSRRSLFRRVGVIGDAAAAVLRRHKFRLVRQRPTADTPNTPTCKKDAVRLSLP